MCQPSGPHGPSVEPPTDESGDRPGALLDQATHTGADRAPSLQSQGSWVAVEHLGTGEGAVYWRRPGGVKETPGGRTERGSGGERAKVEADRRARIKVRRYCVRNGLDILITLTFDNEHLPTSRAGAWPPIETFRRRLVGLVGETFPMLAVIERGAKNGRLHVHLAVGRFIPREQIEAAWGCGFIDVRKIRVAGEGKRSRCRMAAHYLAKYVAKDDQDDREFNDKRYSVAKGFGVVSRSQRVGDKFAGLALLDAWCGGAGVVFMWDSSVDPDWLGPPCVAVHFGDPPPA